MSVTNEAFLQRQSDFWNDIAKTWSLQNKNPVVGWYNEHEAFKEYDTVLFRDIPLTGKETVLEYGCGPARNLIRWANKFRRIDGVDIAPQCIEKARLHLAAAKLPEPNLWVNDGRSLPMIPSAANDPNNLKSGEFVGYDIVFMVISHQHITSRSVRMNLYREFLRVMKPGGYLCFQTGYGPGHPRSVDYMADTFSTEAEFVDKDVRCEDVEMIKKDLETCGFVWKSHVFTRTCKDEHPAWIWIQCQKPSA
jgi:SAM-dependent methyltransferase